MAATMTFAAAMLIVVNLWLIALTSFAITVSASFLYILGAADAVIGPSISISLICSALSCVYLILQYINVRNIRHRSWHKSWLSTTCAQLPRLLIILWIITAIVGLVVVFRQPICQNGDIKVDAMAWQTGIGCWNFRILAALNALMLILSFSIFCLLEVNGRYVSVSLFHLEYTSNQPQRRRTLIDSTYGASVETLTNAMIVASKEDLDTAREKHESHAAQSLSPSPTYHTFDSSTTTLWPGSNISKHHWNHDLSLSEHHIPFDFTVCGSSPSCRSMGLTNTTRTFDTNSANSSIIFSNSQLHCRPMSDIPPLPPKSWKRIHAPGQSDTPLRSADAIAEPSVQPSWPLSNDVDMPAQLALHNVPVNVITPQLSSSRFKSTCALPLEATTRTHSLVDLLSSTTSNPAHCKDQPSTEQNSNVVRLSTTSLPEQPPPAWCPQTLKSAPLSADPAIRRLTELKPRASIAARLSLNKKRGSFGAFEFGFTRTSTTSTPNSAPTTIPQKAVDGNPNEGGDIDLSEVPDTPTPASRALTFAKHDIIRSRTESVRAGNDPEKENRTPMVTVFPNTKPDKETIMNHARTKEHTRTHSRARSRSGTLNAKTSRPKYQLSIMPPVINPTAKIDVQTTNARLGLGIEGIAMRHGKDRNGKSEQGNATISDKKVVERGRYEELPR